MIAVEFVYSLPELATQFTVAFHKKKPLVHALHAKIKKIFLIVLERVLEPNILASADEISMSLLENLDNYL